jgi:uncharacterized protein YdeI (YjbR/CyaY-like superfamily)
MQKTVKDSIPHTLPSDLRKKLETDRSAIERWNDITPLAQNEWICWIITTKKPETRANHISRTITELLEGKRRPCCWAGCPHRKKRRI